MDDAVFTECVRTVAAAAGAATFSFAARSPSGRHWACMVLPGFLAAVFVEPFLCDILSGTLSDRLPWLHCEVPHTRYGLTFGVGLVGHSGVRFVLFAADKLFKNKLQRWLGIEPQEED